MRNEDGETLEYIMQNQKNNPRKLQHGKSRMPRTPATDALVYRQLCNTTKVINNVRCRNPLSARRQHGWRAIGTLNEFANGILQNENYCVIRTPCNENSKVMIRICQLNGHHCLLSLDYFLSNATPFLVCTQFEN